MQRAGWAALEVIPSLRGFESSLNSQTNPVMARSGVLGGGRYGDEAGKSMSSRFVAHAKTAAILAGGVLTGVAAVAIHIGRNSIEEARQAQRVGAITTRVIKSTGQAAHVTAKEVGHLSTAISNRVGIDDEAIQSGANLLLTFKGVRNEVGKGNDIFNQATRLTTDLAVAMASGGEVNLKSSAIQVGKALNDPVHGLTSLTRVGVTFNDQQKEQIKNLVANGKTMQAQKVILGELKSEFSGTAAAQATMGDKVKVAWGNVEENLGRGLLPLIDDVEHAFLKKGVPALNQFSRWFEKDGTKGIESFVKQAGPLAHSILPAAKTGLKDIAGFLRDAAGPAKTVFDAFNSLPGWAQKAVVLGGAGGFIAKKSGAFDLGIKLLGKGNGGPLGALGVAKGTPVDPVWVTVTNAGGLPGAPVGVPGGAADNLIKKTPPIPALAVVAQAAHGINSVADTLRRQKATPQPFDAKALQASHIGGAQGLQVDHGRLKVDIDFNRLAQSLTRYGSRSPYAKQLLAQLKTGASDTGGGFFGNNAMARDENAVRDLQDAINRAGSGLHAHLKATSTEVDALGAGLKATSRDLDLVGTKGGKSFDTLTKTGGEYRALLKTLPRKVQTAIDTPGMVTTQRDIDLLHRKYDLTPKQVRTAFELTGIQEARRQIDALRAHAGRHISAELSIELAGRGPSQRALDGVRR